MDLLERRAFQGRRHPWESARLEIVDGLLRRTPAAEVVIDFGCGDAFVLAALAQRGLARRWVGVDHALEAPASWHESAVPHSGGKASTVQVELVRSLAEAALAPRSVTHVLLLDVLEHLEDPQAVLKALLADPALNPEVVFIVTVPAHQALFTEHDVILGHHRRYSRDALVTLLSDAGLAVGACGSMFASALVFRGAEKLAEQLRRGPPPTESQLSTWNGGRALTRLLASALQWDFRFLERARRRGLPLPGLSLYAVATRR